MLVLVLVKRASEVRVRQRGSASAVLSAAARSGSEPGWSVAAAGDTMGGAANVWGADRAGKEIGSGGGGEEQQEQDQGRGRRQEQWRVQQRAQGQGRRSPPDLRRDPVG